jgi:FkbM family methyltransferase
MSGSRKWKIRQFLSSQGIQVQLGPPTPSVEGFIQSRNIDTVLDVGANIGQFAQQLRRHGYIGRIISFEPISNVYAQLAETCSADPLWDAHHLALGDRDCQSTINISKHTVYSSLLAQTDLAVAGDPNAATVHTETVTVSTLDSLFEGLNPGRTFLKIDTQGFEQAVLAGASKSLHSIEGVQLELPIAHLYVNTWTIDDAIRSMRDTGFVLAQVQIVNSLPDDPQAALEFDCIFRRL